MVQEDPVPNSVLFVDDEKDIQRVALRELSCSDCNFFMAHNAKEGMDILSNEYIDLVISDTEMPGMSGVDFLSKVKDKYPNTHRMLLSTPAEQDAVTRAIAQGLATAHFSKPWQENELIERVEYILEVRKTLKQEKLLESISEIDKLPSLPSLYQEFSEAVSQEMPAKEISLIIEKDVSLCTRLLQIANSAFYGMAGTSSIDSAIVRMGMNAVRDLVLTFSYVNEMNWTPQQLEVLESLFSHSSRVNRFLKQVYRIKHQSVLPLEMASIGITHDIGKVIMLQYFPDRYDSVVKYQQEHPGLTFFQAEKALEYTWFKHEDVGAYFLHMWNLPDHMVEATLFHHVPQKAQGPSKLAIEALAFTNDLVTWTELKAEGVEGDRAWSETGFIPEAEVEKFIGEVEAELNQPAATA